MRKELALHLVSTLILLVLIILIKGWFNLSYWPLVVGGLVGTFLPDVDHLIYVYFFKPEELTSQRVNYLIDKKDIGKSVSLLYETRSERKNLIFHSFYFQLLFWVLTFLVVSSSGSVFGRGVVTTFSLHLIIDQILDLRQSGNIDNWFSGGSSIIPRDKINVFIIFNLVVLGLFSLIF